MSSKWTSLLSILAVIIVVSQCLIAYYLITGENITHILFGNKDEKVSVADGKSPQDGKMNYVHFLDVGQGDCTLIETANGRFVVIDASVGDAEEKILSYFETVGVEEIEYAIFTHPHEDHIGSGDAIVENFKVKNVVMTDKTASTSCYNRLVNAISDSKEINGTKVLKANDGDTYSVDDINFTVLSDGKIYDDLNDSSMCLKFECGENSLLFTGDAGNKVERDILNKDVDVSATIFKCGHHGSSSSNSDAFLNKVKPKVAIISCGRDNSYGHPHEEVELALFERNITYYRTDLDGDVVIGFDGKKIVLPAA